MNSERWLFSLRFIIKRLKIICDNFGTNLTAPKVEVETRTEVNSKSKLSVCKRNKSLLCPSGLQQNIKSMAYSTSS